MLLARYAEWYIPSPWITFQDRHGIRWCQPDGLLVDLHQGMVILIEIKYRHTADAWWGLWKLYRPVMEMLLPNTLWQYRCLELVKWYDPSTVFPGDIALTPHPHRIPRAGVTGVHIWNGKNELQPAG